MIDMLRYKCLGCGLVLVTDLLEDEMLHCPLCAHMKPERCDEGKLILCSDCGLAFSEYDALHCMECNKPLCNECGHATRDGICQSCGAETAWLHEPVPARIF